MSGPPAANNAPIFVVGVERSGTTLMQRLLTAHPRIHVLYETFLAGTRFTARMPADWAAPGALEAFWREYTTYRPPGKLGVEGERVLARTRAAGPSQAALLDAVMRDAAETAGKERPGEKSPYHYKALGRLFAWYPEARVIWMVRDPRAVVASLSNAWFNQSRGFEDILFAWTRGVVWYRRWASDPRVLLVRYEDLVDDPEAVMRRVCAFLGEEYTPAMLSAPGTNTSFGERMGPGSGEISKSSLQRWRKVLTRRQIALIELRAGGKMREMGYRPAAGTPPLTLRLVEAARGLARRLPGQQRQADRG